MASIEKPTIKDGKEIQYVFYKTWLATYPNEVYGITSEDIDERFKDRISNQGVKKTTETILHEAKYDHFFVAKEDGKVVGVCRLKAEETYNELMAIYVLPDYQRKGIGRMLWDKAMEIFGGEKDIIVHVATYNKKAIGFYKKLGFIDAGKRFIDKRIRMPISGSYIPEMELIIKAMK